jgi:MFS family permease
MSQAITTPFRRYPNFSLLLFARFASTAAMLAQGVTLGWQVYSIARVDHSVEQSSFLVGMIGLAQFLPMFALVLLAGETADRYDRRKVLLGCCALQVACSSGLALLANTSRPSLVAIFALSAVFGIGRAFTMPTSAALGPMLVPRDILPRAIGWNTLAMQSGMVLGPWIGGLMCASSVPLSYTVSAALYVIAGIAVFQIGADTKPDHKGGERLKLIAEGLSYVWSNKIVFGAISLDLFAVLLGGATALLPIYARDILHTGPWGLGVLRGAPAVGALLMTAWLARYPINRRVGMRMFRAVIVFGIATIVFGLSHVLLLSLLALTVMGAANMVSVVIRLSLVQLATPDAMRGRVGAVNFLFINTSNQLGEFESGMTAALLGAMPAVMLGGIGTIMVALLWMKLFPSLAQMERLE